MAIFNKLHKFFVVLLLGTVFTAQAGYYTREINLTDDAEVTKVAQELFYREHQVTDQQTGLTRAMTSAEREQELSRAKDELLEKANNNSNIFVSVLAKDKQIYGILYCKYGHRNAGMVECMRSKVYNQSGVKRYISNNFITVMQSMTQYAEAFYKGMSMKSIVIHAMSKDNASFYTGYGYRLLNEQEANDLYYTTAENVAFLLGLPLLIAFFPIYMLYKACDWGIYYKELY
jgi:hypothetical protein